MSDKRMRIPVLLVLLAVACAAATGCDDEDRAAPPSDTSPPDAPRFGLSSMRVLHASPDLPSVDVYVDEETTPFFSGLDYGEATGYVTLPVGDHVLHLRAAGASVTSPALFSSTPVAVPGEDSLSVAAVGLYGEGSHDKALRVVPLSDAFAPAAPGTIRVRVLHGGMDASTLAVDIDGDGAAEITELDRFEDSGEGGLELPANTLLRMGLMVGEETLPLTTFTLPPQQEGSTLLIVITGLLSAAPRQPEGFSLVAANQEGAAGRIRQDPVVYVLNAASTTDSVDVFLDNTEQADSLEFGEMSARVQVGTDAPSVDVFISSPTSNRPGGEPLVSLSTGGLTAGEQYLAVLTGPFGPVQGGSPHFQLLPYAERFEPDAERLRMRIVHAAPGLSAVDAGPLDPNQQLPTTAAADDLPFTQATAPEGLPLPTVEFVLGMRPADDPGAPLTEFFIGPGPLLRAGVFAVLAQDAFDVPHLLLVSTARTPWTVQDIAPREAFGTAPEQGLSHEDRGRGLACLLAPHGGSPCLGAWR